MSAKLIIFSLLGIGMPLLSNNCFLAKKNYMSDNYNKKPSPTGIVNDQEIKFLNVSGILYEYKRNQVLNILINLNKPSFNPKEINNITLLSKTNSKVYKPKTECFLKSYKIQGLGTDIYCYLDLKLIPKGEYLISYFYYQNKKINDRKTLIIINEEKKEPIEKDLELIAMHGNAFNNTMFLYNLLFNKNVNVEYFSTFYLTELNPILSYAYYFNFSFYENKDNSSVYCLFDINRVRAGTYYFNYVYKNKTYPTNFTLTLSEKKITTENELFDVFSNFEINKDNQIAYFYFNGKNMSNTLDYIVLNDGYSQINVIETFGCNILNYDNLSFVLKCNLNITNVDEGIYTISEYSINNQHYYSEKMINVTVQ